MPRERTPTVYILANVPRGTLYIGVTSNPGQRIWLHKNDLVKGFTNKYQVHHLVWYEVHETMDAAITKEKALKFWKRLWKIQLVERLNPTWKDLADELT